MLTGLMVLSIGDTARHPVREAVESVTTICDKFILALPPNERTPALDGWSGDIGNVQVHCPETLSRQQRLESAWMLCRPGWCLHLQPDEVVHDADLPIIRDMLRAAGEDTDAFLTRHRFFCGSYDYCLRRSAAPYAIETRFVRVREGVGPSSDGRTFRWKEGPRLRTRSLPIELYHYGMIPPPNMPEIRTTAHILRYNALAPQLDISREIRKCASKDVTRFTGTHPTVMTPRIVHSRFPSVHREVET